MAKSDQNSRQPRSNKSFGRKPPDKNQQNRILIVCEGETEKIYFKLLCNEYKLQSVVLIESAQGGTPIRAVDLAIRKTDHTFDQSWCVIDTESVNNKNIFDEAIDRAKQSKIMLAVSNPCIEYWFILHFEKTTIALADGKETLRKLKTHISDYDKNQTVLIRILLQRILPRTSIAIDNAAFCMEEIKRTTADEYPSPCTTISELVDLLNKMSKNKPY